MRFPYRMYQRLFVVLAISCGFVLVGAFIHFTRVNAEPIPAEQQRDSASLLLHKADPLPANLRSKSMRLVQENSGSIVLDFTAPEYTWVEGEAGGAWCKKLQVDGFASASPAGHPEIPVHGTMIGIPASGEPVVQVIESQLVDLPGQYNLCPVSSPILEYSSGSQPEFQGYQALRDREAYSVASFQPAEAVVLFSTGFIRSQRVAQLRYQPFQYNAATGQIRYYRSLKVRVSFPAAGLRGETENLHADEGAFESFFRDNLVNYAQARFWRGHSPEIPKPAQDKGKLAGSWLAPAYKVLVAEDGIHRLGYHDLLAAGIPVDTIDPRTIQLQRAGSETALWVSGEQDGIFNASDVLWFYGQKADSRYTATNTYWLTWGGSPGLRMPERAAAPQGLFAAPEYYTTSLRIEQNSVYLSGLPSGPDLDRWYWYEFFGTKAASVKFSFTLSDVATVPESATFSGILSGQYAAPKHYTDIYLNGTLIDRSSWPSYTEYTFSTPVPHALLRSGNNEIVVSQPYPPGMLGYFVMYINRFDLNYARRFKAVNGEVGFEAQAGAASFTLSGFSTNSIHVFDVTEAEVPVRLSGVKVSSNGSGYEGRFDHAVSGKRRYLAAAAPAWRKPALMKDLPSDLHNPDQGADYIVITHPSFYTDVLPLAAYRTGQGLRVKVVSVQDVYDEFGGGLLDPEAIQKFLAYAYTDWQPPAPMYVLLVGDGNYDTLDYTQQHEPQFIPPFLDAVDFWIGETATDNRFAMVSGNDVLPDLHIGRLPVKTRAEAAALVQKIIGYEANPSSEDWMKRVMFVADNPDNGGDFYAYSNLIADQYLPQTYIADKIYYAPGAPAVSYQKAITSGINDGRLMVNYVGHGAMFQWANERLLWNDKLYSLDNRGKLPFMVPMTCLEGYWINPPFAPAAGRDMSALAERLLRLPEKGSIASFSPAGFGLASGHDYLERGLFSAIFKDYAAQLGPATTQAKLYLYARTGGAYQDLIETYTLLGDPATTLPLPRPEVALRMTAQGPDYSNPYAPVITYILSYTNTGQGMATHVLIGDALPAWVKHSTFRTTGPAVTARAGAPYVWDVADISPGASGQITLTVQVDPLYRGEFSNQASIASAGELGVQSNNQAKVVLPNPYYPELALTKKVLPVDLRDPYDLKVIYQLDYSNRGNLLAMDVVLTDSLPAWAISSSYVYSGPVVTARLGAPYVWDVADLPAGAAGRITLTLGVDYRFMGLYDNQASISGAAELGPQDDNRAQAVGRNPHYPDAGLVKTALPPDFSNPLAPVLTYVLDYANPSLVWANQVVITDSLPAWALTSTYTYSGPALHLRPGTRYIWDAADMSPGASGRITMTIQADRHFLLPYRNMASISAAGEYGPQENNFAQAVARVFKLLFPVIARNPYVGR